MAAKKRNHPPLLYFIGGVFISWSLVITISLLVKVPTQKSSHGSNPWIRDFAECPGASTDKLNSRPTSPVSGFLRKKVRILCWVLTPSANIEKARSVQTTWGSRCDITLFFSSVTNHSFPIIGLGVPEGRDYLFKKTMKAFHYIHENHFNNADWFLKADDDTYVILENLRYFLYTKNTSDPVYYGQKLHNVDYHGYNSGGAGYVLSKEALKRLAIRGPSIVGCKVQDAEDVVMGRCLNHLGVKTGTTLDDKGRNTFHSIGILFMTIGRLPVWLSKDAKIKGGLSAMSNRAISFHYSNIRLNMEMEYFLYRLKVYGVNKRLSKLIM